MFLPEPMILMQTESQRCLCMWPTVKL